MSCLMYAISDEKFLELIRRSSSVKEVLQTLGYNGPFEGLTAEQASSLIDQYKANRPNNRGKRG